MFDDRAQSIQTLQKNGEELIANTEDQAKKEEIQADLDHVNDMWVDLQEQIKNRRERLDETLVAAEKFNTDLENVLNAIQEIGEQVDSEGFTPCGELEKVDEQIEQFKVVSEQVTDLEPFIAALNDEAQQLGQYCTRDDIKALRMKLDSVSKKYDKMLANKHNKEHVLQETHDLLEEFAKQNDELNQWMIHVQHDLEDKRQNGAEAEKIRHMQKDVVSKKPDVDKLKECSKAIQKLVKGDEYPAVEEQVEQTEEKYKALKAAVDESARDMFMAKEKVQAFEEKLDQLSTWTVQELEKFRVIEPVAVEAERIKEQLNEQQGLLTECAVQEALFKEVNELGDTILMACNEEEEPAIREKLDKLNYNKRSLDQLIKERQSHLVEALLLAQQFADIHTEATARLDRTELMLRFIDESKSKGVAIQQEKLQNIQDNINQLQPLMTSLHSTGADLIKISGPGQASASIEIQIANCDERWQALKSASEDKGIKISAAAEQGEAVLANVEDLISKLQGLKDGFKSQESVPVKEEPLVEELVKLQQVEVDLKELTNNYNSVNESVENVLSEDADSPAAVALKDRQRKMNNVYKFVVDSLKDKKQVVENSKSAAQRFWPGLEKIKDTLADVQAKMDDLGEPPFEVEEIDQLLREHELLHQDLDSNDDVITVLSEAAPILVSKASQEDKVGVHKQLSDVTDLWDSIENAWSKMKNDLQSLRELVIDFKKDRDNIAEWMAAAELALDNAPPTPSDPKSITEELRQQRATHRDLVKRQIEITQFAQKGNSVMDIVNNEGDEIVSEIVRDIEKRWDDLMNASNDRQNVLEDALVERGHLGVAMDELLAWVAQTKATLADQHELPKDKKLLEVELSKLKIVANDVQAHEASITNMQNSADQMLQNAQPRDREVLEGKINELGVGWQEIQDLLASREQALQDAMNESRKFNDRVRDLNNFLNEAKSFLKSSRPIGGKVPVTESQVAKHQEFVKVIEVREETYIYIIQTFEVLISSSDISSARVLEKAMNEIRVLWEEVITLSTTITTRLDHALIDAREFEKSFGEMEIWMTRVEGSMSLFGKVSTILETIKEQFVEFEVFHSEVVEHREILRHVKGVAHKLTETCAPDDAKEIKHDIAEMDKRWKELNTKAKEHKKELDENLAQSEIFFEGEEQLMAFLDNIEAKINSDHSIGKDAQTVKVQMRKHKELQNELGKKQSKLNATLKAGKNLVTKSEPDDAVTLETKIEELRVRWDAICALSVDRQHQLEEALLFHGMFHDAMQALMDWLNVVEPSLATETAVMGDTETVKLLIDNHKAFQRDLGNRQKNFDSIMKTGEAMLNEGKVDNLEDLQEQLDELSGRWESVCQMSVTKQERLHNAFVLSKEFQSGCKSCVSNLGDLEDELKTQGPIAEDVPSIRQQIEDFASFQEKLDHEEVHVNGVLKKGEVILRFCHPSALQTIRHQIAVVKRRWHDVAGWAQQRKLKLEEGLEQLLEEQRLIEILMIWITEQEIIIEEREKIPLVEDYNVLNELMNEHKVTQAEADGKQPDYVKITKNAKKKPLTDRQRHAMTHNKGRLSSGPESKEFANPQVTQLSKRWQHYWLILMERYRKLQAALEQIRLVFDPKIKYTKLIAEINY